MGKWFNNYFYFSRRERRGIIVLLTAAILIYSFGILYHYLSTQTKEDETGLEQQLAMKEALTFANSIHQQEQKLKQNRESLYRTWQKTSVSPLLTTFDPNTADSLTFRRLGLPAWMARNILRYREKGGVFRRLEDFRKIYGMTDEQYALLRPYIVLETIEPTPRPSLFLSDVSVDSLQSQKPIKYAPGTVVDLNRADTTELKKIPGIGSAIARLISGYRQQLGGFYSLGQLKDVNLDYRQLIDWFCIDTTAIRRIPVNRSSVDRLRRHPYLNFYQAKALVEYRRKHGPLKNLKPFVLYEEFTQKDLERISHYLSFE